jgi:hypothetical protein
VDLQLDSAIIGNTSLNYSSRKYSLLMKKVLQADKFYSKYLDLFIGFGGTEPTPNDVRPFVNSLVEKIAIFGVENQDLWKVVQETLIAFPMTVKTNTVIAAFATGDGFMARKIGMHRAERPLGCLFVKCGAANCESKNRPGHIIGELKDQRMAKIRCKSCGWKSKWVKIDNQEIISRLHKTRSPLLFYHEFPSPPGLSSLFF